MIDFEWRKGVDENDSNLYFCTKMGLILGTVKKIDGVFRCIFEYKNLGNYVTMEEAKQALVNYYQEK